MSSNYIFGGHPYVDRHFNLDSTPRYGNYGGGMYGTHGDHTLHSATCSNGTCARTGGTGGGNCPPVQNAILRLWVPDDATVEINGYPTRPQTLGGIHRGSRVYSLEGLDTDRISPCEIVVCFGDQLNQQRFHREITVQAGGHYQIRFPDSFERISWISLENSMPVDRTPVPEFSYADPSELQTQIEHAQHLEQHERPNASEDSSPQPEAEQRENVPGILQTTGEQSIMEH